MFFSIRLFIIPYKVKNVTPHTPHSEAEIDIYLNIINIQTFLSKLFVENSFHQTEVIVK